MTRSAAGSAPSCYVRASVSTSHLPVSSTRPTIDGSTRFSAELMVVSVLQPPPPADVQRSGVVRGSVGCMLMHFFETFGLRFNHDVVGVSVQDGGHFFAKRDRSWLNADRPYLLAVENPLDSSHDVGANSYNIRSVKRVFSHAYFALHAALAGDASGGSSCVGGDGGGGTAGCAADRGQLLHILGRLVWGLADEMEERFAMHEKEAHRGPREARVGARALATGTGKDSAEEPRTGNANGEECDVPHANYAGEDVARHYQEEVGDDSECMHGVHAGDTCVAPLKCGKRGRDSAVAGQGGRRTRPAAKRTRLAGRGGVGSAV